MFVQNGVAHVNGVRRSGAAPMYFALRPELLSVTLSADCTLHLKPFA